MPPLLACLAEGAAVSGRDLAARLGISRSAVSRRVGGWREAGLEITADARGYRLLRPIEPLDVDRIRALLTAPVAKCLGAIENHWQLDSTSSEIARRVAALPDPAFVFADWQLAGRGRRGRQWLSPPATNLQFSCLKRFAGDYASLAGLSLAAGTAVAQALEDCGAAGIGLKWPNDVVHGNAKLGGILVELGGEPQGPCHAIIGIGINVYLPESMRLMLGRPCADLAVLAGGKPPSRNVLAAALIGRLTAALDVFDRDGFAAFAEAFARRDVLDGRVVRVAGTRVAFDGIAAGVDARGSLQVRSDTGLHGVDSGEVTVRAA